MSRSTHGVPHGMGTSVPSRTHRPSKERTTERHVLIPKRTGKATISREEHHYTPRQTHYSVETTLEGPLSGSGSESPTPSHEDDGGDISEGMVETILTEPAGPHRYTVEYDDVALLKSSLRKASYISTITIILSKAGMVICQEKNSAALPYAKASPYTSVHESSDVAFKVTVSRLILMAAINESNNSIRFDIEGSDLTISSDTYRISFPVSTPYEFKMNSNPTVDWDTNPQESVLALKMYKNLRIFKDGAAAEIPEAEDYDSFKNLMFSMSSQSSCENANGCTLIKIDVPDVAQSSHQPVISEISKALDGLLELKTSIVIGNGSICVIFDCVKPSSKKTNKKSVKPDDGGYEMPLDPKGLKPATTPGKGTGSPPDAKDLKPAANPGKVLSELENLFDKKSSKLIRDEEMVREGGSPLDKIKAFLNSYHMDLYKITELHDDPRRAASAVTHPHEYDERHRKFFKMAADPAFVKASNRKAGQEYRGRHIMFDVGEYSSRIWLIRSEPSGIAIDTI